MKLLTIQESHEVTLPSFNLIDDLTKNNLLLYCMSTPLKDFLPDRVNVDTITRGYLLKIIYQKDRFKFQTLEEIVKNVNSYKEQASLTGVSVNVPKQFLDELEKFNAYSNSKNGKIFSIKSDLFMRSKFKNVNLSKQEKKSEKKKNIENYLNQLNIQRNQFNID